MLGRSRSLISIDVIFFWVLPAGVAGKCGLDGSVTFAHDQHHGSAYDPTIGQHVNDQNTNGFRAKQLA